MDRENSPPCTKARRTGESPHLHQEIIEEEILPRLPVKSLLRFRCVWKSWGSLIGSKRFIKTHHQNSIKNPSFPQQRVILQMNMSEYWPEQRSLLSVLSEPTNTIPLSPLADPTNTTFSRMRFQILGCYNGLLCILDQSRRIHLWNPSTRISKKLPKIFNGGDVRKLGFGWVESSGEYKMFVLVDDSHSYDWKWLGKVYSSKTKSWKTIEHCADLLSCWASGVFAGGKLYWGKKGDNKDIVFLDLKSEVFGRIEMPFDQEFRVEEGWEGVVGVLGGCLCVLYYNPFSHYKRGVRVWVMKESWERVATLANLVELLQPTPLEVGEKGKILVNCGSILLVYDRWDNMFCHLGVGCHYSSYHVYVESLISPEDM